ncbi:hypothetical protein ETB97_007245 [Aspergillus alliaceus]|uniref:Uncharacterized protein n=1 Tax=Petromyces alliaceus TaxID=209559 RepID=A0A8H6E238_PETAA|nr:hypothetical protein ETB97_007245 [Aspergillus burnettii]
MDDSSSPSKSTPKFTSFLQKNTFTVTESELRAPKRGGNYDKIKFVKEVPLGCTTDASVDDSPSPIVSVSETHPLSDPVDSPEVITGDRRDSQIGLVEPHDHGNSMRQDTLHLPLWAGALDTHLSDGGAPHRDNDDAAQGLLALGSGSSLNSIMTKSTDLPLSNAPVALSSLVNTGPWEVKDSAPPTTTSGVIDETEHFSATGLSSSVTATPITVSETRRLELLRHYRYHVAPWLDICDLRHPFGIAVFQTARSSEQLLSALLGLSETCIIQPAQWNRPSLGQLSLRKRHQLSQLDNDHPDFTECILIILIEEVRSLVTNVPQAWTDLVNRDVSLVDPLVQYAYSKTILSAVYWMFLRIDLGVALANDIPLRLSLPMLPVPNLSLICRTEDTYERVSHYAHVILWLCGKALTLCNQEATPHPLAASHEVMESWLQTFGELDQWYHLRPPEFQPIVEIDERDQTLNQGSEFPLLLFSNGAGTFSNQIYHTTMLLLLQRKPRTALLNHPQSPALSPLWHAHRICGIALNNDTRESWDPSLLASMLVAAKHMTHESQQQEILQAFDRIHVITGWDTGKYLTHLKEEWSFLDGM